MNIILLASTAVVPAISLSTTGQAVQLRAPAKRQRVTEAKGVVLLWYIQKATGQWHSYGNTW